MKTYGNPIIERRIDKRDSYKDVYITESGIPIMRIRVLEINETGKKVRLRITAPKEYGVIRGELISESELDGIEKKFKNGN